MSRYRRASEIGEFVFCHRAWWLHHIQGHSSHNRGALEAGEAAHRAHGRTVVWAARLRQVAFLLLLAALLLLVLSLWGRG